MKLLNYKSYFLSRVKKKINFCFSKRAGKNCFGRKTVFTQSGGLKLYRYFVDIRRITTGYFVLLNIEKNFIYTGFLGFICYLNGTFVYIYLSKFVNDLGLLYNAFGWNFSKGSTFLYNFPAGSFIHHVEVIPSKGVKIMRAAGTMCFIFSKLNNITVLKMGKSGWMLKLSNYCVAILGNMSNESHFITRIKNAGKKRKLGFRPTVRGVAKNPVDHPHGGGEGTGSPPRAHRTPYGKMAKSPTNIKKSEKRYRYKFKIFKK